MIRLYHYTCDHGREALGDRGRLRPARALTDALDPEWWPSHYVWLTPLILPDRAGLGLTTQLITCDRTAYRYRVTNITGCRRWADVRGRHDDAELLEAAPGARPEMWWVARRPVPVEYDPVPVLPPPGEPAPL